MRNKILAINFNEGDRANLLKAFSRQYDIRFTENVATAMRINKEALHLLIILNMEIPDSVTTKDLRRMQKQDILERPIIIITSHNSIEDERALAATGVYYYLLRPYDLKDLNDLFRGALQFWHKKSLEPARVFRKLKFTYAETGDDRNHEY
jgi:DNA-binding NtrC family response regulator